MLLAQLGGVLHVYAADSHVGNHVCELCVQFTSVEVGLVDAAAPVLDVCSDVYSPTWQCTPAAAQDQLPQRIRAPPQFS